MTRLLVTILLTLCTSLRTALALGEWTLYNSSSTYTQLAELGTRIYTLCGTSIFWYDREDATSGALSIADGLHGSDVAHICASHDFLVVVYADGLIDVMNGQGHVRDFIDLQKRVITGSRHINGVKACGDELFLACDFGVVGIDLQHLITTCSFTTTTPVTLAFAHGDYLYANTLTQGLRRCPRSRNPQVADFWSSVEEQPVLDACVFADADGQMQCWYTQQEGGLICCLDSAGQSRNLNLWNNRKLYPSMPYVFCSGWGVQIADATTGQEYPPMADLHDSYFNPIEGYCADGRDGAYVLHSTLGLQHVTLHFEPGDEASFLPDDEPEDQPYNYSEYLGTKLVDMDIDAQGNLVAIDGAQYRTEGYTAMTTRRSIINTLHADQSWTYIQEDSVIAQLRRMVPDPDAIPADYYRGLTCITAHPDVHGRFCVGTIVHGMYVFDADSLMAHYDANTQQGPSPTTYSSTDARVTAMTYDDEGYLWAGSSFAECPLAALSPDGQWVRHPLTSANSNDNIGRIITTKASGKPYVWLVRNCAYESCSVSILHNPAGPLSTEGDESVTFGTLVDQDGNALLPHYIYDICEDHAGRMWLLTSNGPLVVEDQVRTFEYARQNPGRGAVRRVKIPRNDGTNLADYLMAEVSTLCMAIDNYDRKWVGTTNGGLFLLSADCLTQIHHFTAANSILPSDEIVAMRYDAATNRLFVSTAAGLVCYATDDLTGATDYADIHCYPNPVRPEYSGELRIMGLMDDSTVSITNTVGDLIYRGVSQGSTLSWDMRTADGSRIAPGVYLIHAVAAESRRGTTTRFLVL